MMPGFIAQDPERYGYRRCKLSIDVDKYDVVVWMEGSEVIGRGETHEEALNDLARQLGVEFLETWHDNRIWVREI